MRLAITAASALLALGGCDLSLDTGDGRVSAHLGVHWEAPDRTNQTDQTDQTDQVVQVGVVGDAIVEVYVHPWIRHASATARGDGGTLDGLVLTSSGGRLSLVGDTAPGVVVMVEVPALERASLVGGGRLSVFGANTETLDLSLAGSGRLDADGWTGRVRVDASGDGTVDAGSLHASTAEATLRGQALAIVCVSGTVDAIVDADSAIIRRCQ